MKSLPIYLASSKLQIRSIIWQHFSLIRQQIGKVSKSRKRDVQIDASDQLHTPMLCLSMYHHLVLAQDLQIVFSTFSIVTKSDPSYVLLLRLCRRWIYWMIIIYFLALRRNCWKTAKIFLIIFAIILVIFARDTKRHSASLGCTSHVG